MQRPTHAPRGPRQVPGPPNGCSDPLADPSCSLALLIPDRQQYGHDVRRGDIAHAHLAQPRHRIVPQACLPLCGGLAAVLPSRLVNADHCLGGIRKGRNTLAGTKRARVAALPRQLAVFESLLARLVEGDVGPAAQSEVCALAVNRSAPDPLLAARHLNPQLKAMPVPVLVGTESASVPDGFDEGCGQETFSVYQLTTILSRKELWDSAGRGRPPKPRWESYVVDRQDVMRYLLKTCSLVLADSGDPLHHHAAGFEKILCSAVFITALDADFAAEDIG